MRRPSCSRYGELIPAHIHTSDSVTTLLVSRGWIAGLKYLRPVIPIVSFPLCFYFIRSPYRLTTILQQQLSVKTSVLIRHGSAHQTELKKEKFSEFNHSACLQGFSAFAEMHLSQNDSELLVALTS